MSPPGTIGILFEAKRRALIQSLKKELVDLIIKSVFLSMKNFTILFCAKLENFN